MSNVLSKINGDFVLFYVISDAGEAVVLSSGQVKQKAKLRALADKRLSESSMVKTNPSQ